MIASEVKVTCRFSDFLFVIFGLFLEIWEGEVSEAVTYVAHESNRMQVQTTVFALMAPFSPLWSDTSL